MTTEPLTPNETPVPPDPAVEKADPALARQVSGAMMWNVVLFPIKFVVGLVAGLIVPNLLGQQRYGLYILITGVAVTLGSYIDLGMERSLPRYIPEVAKRFGARGLRRFLREVIGSKIILLLALILVFNLFSAPLLGYMRNSEVKRLNEAQSSLQTETDPAKQSKLEEQVAAHKSLINRLDSEGHLYLLTISAMLLLSVIYDACIRLLQAYFRQKASNAIDLAMTITQPTLIIGLVYFGWDFKGVLVAMVVTPVIGVAMAWWRMARAVSSLPEEGKEEYQKPRQVWPRFLSFSGISYIMQLTSWIYDLGSLSLITAAVMSANDVGTLGVASKFVSLFLNNLMIPLTGIQVPLFAHIYARKGEGDIQGAFSVLSQFLLLLLVPTGVGLALLSPSLMAIMYSSFPPETAKLVLVFTAAMFLETLIGTPQQMLLVYERYGVIIAARLSALSIIPLLFLLVPRYGLMGAAVAAGIARVLSRAISFFYGMRYFPLRFPWRFAGRIAGGSAAMLVALYPLTRLLHIDQVGSGWAGKLPVLGKDVALALLGVVVFWAVFKAMGGLEREAKKRLGEMRFPMKEVVLKLL